MASSYSVSTIFGAKDKMSPVFNKMSKSANGFGSVLKGVLSARIIEQGFRKLVDLTKSFVTEAQKIEDATAAFTPLMGGVGKATELVNRLNKEAATTPFQFEGIAGVAKQLLPVMNQNIEKTADTFRMLGDTAGGNIEKLDSITRGYVKALLKGKPDMEALNMIAEAGVPIFSEMSKSMGIAQSQLFELSKQGKLTNNDLTAAFKRMTSEGGIFFKGMEIASQTLTGKISTLKDNIALTKAAIGSALLPILKPAIDGLINLAGASREWAMANKEVINSKITGFINNLKAFIDNISPSLNEMKNTFSILWNTVSGFVKELMKNLLPSGNQTKKIFQTISKIFKVIVDIIKTFLRAIKPLMPMIKEIVAIIIKGFEIIGNVMTVVWEKARGPVEKYWNTVSRIIAFTWKVIKAAVTAIYGIVVGIFTGIKQFITGIINFIKNIFVTTFNNIKEFIGIFVSLFKGDFTGVKDHFFNILENIKMYFKNAFDAIKDIVLGVWNVIKTPFEKIGKFFKNIFSKDKNIDVTEKSFTEAQQSAGIDAPNRREAEAKTEIQFQGQLNIAGAPEGSTFKGDTKGAPPIRYQMLGAN